MDTAEMARAYAANGWALVGFARGTKGPTHHGWNLLEKTTREPEEAACLDGNIGLCHAYSGTCALDIDAWGDAESYLAQAGIHLDEYWNAPEAVRLVSGRAGRGKLIFRLPPGTQPLPSLRPKGSGLELRCATAGGLTVQDVLPPSIHPVTGKPYVWEYADDLIGHWSCPPELPPTLLALWRSLLAPAQAPEQRPKPTGVAAERLRGMLTRIDPDSEYHEWVKIGMALHHESEGDEWGLDLWDEWSSRGSKYRSYDDLVPHWRSFGSNRGRSVTVQSIINLAGVAPEDFDDLSTLPEQPKRPKFEVVQVASFAAGPSPLWIVKGLIPAATLGSVFAESGAGKSFAMVDIAFSIARGTAWNSQRVRQGKVVYVAAEGADGMRKRSTAYAEHHNINLADVPLGFIAGRPNLLQEDHKALGDAVNAWGGADVLVIDTLAQSMPGGDENSSESMGKVIAHCQLLHSLTGAMVMLVHHAGKDIARGARGWSGIKGAMDCELEIQRDGDQRTLRVSKQKDGEDGAGWGFRLNQVSLGTDLDGDPITSCVVEWGDMPSARGRGLPPEGWQRTIYEWVRDNLQLGEGGISTRVILDSVVDLVPPDPNGLDRRRDNARRSLERLIQTKWFVYDGNNVALGPGS
jgi:hypothetical protein